MQPYLKSTVLALSAVVLWVVASVPAAAQVRTAFPEKRGFKLTDFPRTVKLAENVYGYEEIRQPGFTTGSCWWTARAAWTRRRRWSMPLPR